MGVQPTAQAAPRNVRRFTLDAPGAKERAPNRTAACRQDESCHLHSKTKGSWPLRIRALLTLDDELLEHGPEFRRLCGLEQDRLAARTQFADRICGGGCSHECARQVGDELSQGVDHIDAA